MKYVDVVSPPATETKKTFDPLGDGMSCVELIQHVGSDKMILHAARVSYTNDSRSTEFDERDEKLLRYLIQNNHGTPLEHNLITYKLRAPLFVIQEILRHRIGISINQESHRYVEPSKDLKFARAGAQGVRCVRQYYIPRQFRMQDQKNKQGSTGVFDEEQNARLRAIYCEACEKSFETYDELISAGVAREIARGVLPHCTYSSLYFTCNIRSLVHYLELRLHPRAQWEIQQYAKAMSVIAEQLFPETFAVLRELKKL